MFSGAYRPLSPFENEEAWRMKKLALSLAVMLAAPTALCAGQFEPYKIKPGISYYSDDYTTNGGVSELGEEKNYEEVYQNYNYYEAIFDSQERVVIFNAYERGVIEFSESYHYDNQGRLVKKVVKSADGSETIVNFQAGAHP